MPERATSEPGQTSPARASPARASPAQASPAQASRAQASPDHASPQRRGVITDWGGVMTNPIADTMNAWLQAEGIDKESYTAAIRPWLQQAYADGGAENPVHALERGDGPLEEFEEALACQLVRFDGQPVAAAGLLARMFGGSILDDAMVEVMRALRRGGIRTALLSNSWGGTAYPRELFPELFDAVVISSEVGMRKPEERIFRHAAGLLGLAPEECVFIDDIEANVLAARALGLAGLHHQDPRFTIGQLSELLGVELAQ